MRPNNPRHTLIYASLSRVVVCEDGHPIGECFVRYVATHQIIWIDTDSENSKEPPARTKTEDDATMGTQEKNFAGRKSSRAT